MSHYLCVLCETLYYFRDLAARNCLVFSNEDAESDRVIITKIGDFGLAKELYAYEYYKHKGDKPLPLRCKHYHYLDIYLLCIEILF